MPFSRSVAARVMQKHCAGAAGRAVGKPLRRSSALLLHRTVSRAASQSRVFGSERPDAVNPTAARLQAQAILIPYIRIFSRIKLYIPFYQFTANGCIAVWL